MADELIDALTHVTGLKVPSRTSSFAYKGRNVDIRTVAHDLGVNRIIEGSVRSAGDQVRITAQLIDAQSGYHVWSHTYDRPFNDIFQMQDELASAIVHAMLGTADSVPASVATVPPRTDPETYRLVLQANAIANSYDGAQRALELYDDAISRDKRFVRAYVGKAQQLAVMVDLGILSPQSLVEAAETIQRAIVFNADASQVRVVSGYISALRGRWADADMNFGEALANESRDPAAEANYAVAVLARTGRVERATVVAEAAYRQAPASIATVAPRSIVASLAGNEQLAIDMADRACRLGMAEDYRPSTSIRMSADIRGGRYEEAARHALALMPPEWVSVGGMDVVKTIFSSYGDPNLRAAASRALTALVRQTAFSAMNAEWIQWIMTAFVRLDDLDAAFDFSTRYLDSVMASGFVGSPVWLILWIPDMQPYRRDSRFQDLVTRLGFIDYWQREGLPDSCDLQNRKLVCH
jgi:hypothetical protein